MTAPAALRLRAFDSTGTREAAGEWQVEVPDVEHEQQHPVLAAAASAALGAPVALLGGDGPEVLCVEVLDPAGQEWVDAELPEGWAQRAPWRQPGWLTATVERIDAELAGAGLRRTGDVVQAKHWSISALLRVPTDGGDVWFKQVPPMFAHEGRLNAWLAELLPGAVARPLAVGDDWWIAHDLGPSVEGTGDPVDVLTGLQRASIGRTDELLALGCPDRRPQSLPEAIGALVDGVPEELREPLRAVLPGLTRVVGELERLELPDTLVHGDFHGGNARLTATGWVIYDWTDGCVSNPLIDLAPEAFTDPQRLTATAAAWGIGPDQARLGQIAGAAHQVISYERIAAGVEKEAGARWAGAGTRWVTRLVEQLSSL